MCIRDRYGVAKMIIPKKARYAVYSYLFKEGVMVAKKDPSMKKHGDVDVPNLYVIQLLKSMKSRGYVNEQFSWMWYYWYLTNEGIEYLRDYLHLPAQIVPTTLKKPRQAAPRVGFGGRPRGGFGGPRNGPPRGGFNDGKKQDTAGAGFAPSFRGAGGRGFGYASQQGGAPRPAGGARGRGFYQGN
eukprot:TRINITY_DN849_c0_g1_i2.p1 TRINITY_DN849_c0_g1~~TRINITY_DN849_c0_g1_i2.p1  ORF type:complete len:185 (+),score=35.90 TRINITY_DN849_c0_g1_i2:46-600(+)